MISNLRYWFLLFLVLLVYIAGMFVTLFENDSAQYATMAMRIAQENDFINLFKGNEEFLGKPPLHFWLAAFSFKIFGIYDWAYRIPAVLATILGAYSCYGLGRLLYNLNVGKLAALIFITSQIVILSNIDVKTDAVFSGFSIFALWQIARYIEKRSLSGILLGAFGAGVAFAAQGQVAFWVIGLPLLCHLLYTRKWKRLFSWKVLIALLVFMLTIAPVLYTYFLQFDLNLDTSMGAKGSGTNILTILRKQGFASMIEEGGDVKNGTDYFYFFHSFLWVFLPWTVIGFFAYISRLESFIRLRFRYNPKYEFLTLGGITLIFSILVFAQFGLSQYLNLIIPLFSILTASYLYSLYRFRKFNTFKGILGIQYFVLGVIFILSVLLCYFVFKGDTLFNYIWKIALALMAIFYSLKRENYYYRIITVSVLGALMFNAVLNTHFFPELLKYQAGSLMAQTIAEKEIPVENIYKLPGCRSWALDFYNKEPVKPISINKILNKKNIWVYSTELQLRELHNLGYDWDRQYQVDQFKISHLQTKFLDPSTRKSVLNKMYLIHIY